MACATCCWYTTLRWNELFSVHGGSLAHLTFQEVSGRAIKDVYKHVVSYFAGGVLNAPQFFFVVVAFVYGYFFTGSLLEIFRHVQWRKVNYVVFGLAALLFLVKNIEGVNTVRTGQACGCWFMDVSSITTRKIENIFC